MAQPAANTDTVVEVVMESLSTTNPFTKIWRFGGPYGIDIRQVGRASIRRGERQTERNELFGTDANPCRTVSRPHAFFGYLNNGDWEKPRLMVMDADSRHGTTVHDPNGSIFSTQAWTHLDVHDAIYLGDYVGSEGYEVEPVMLLIKSITVVEGPPQELANDEFAFKCEYLEHSEPLSEAPPKDGSFSPAQA